VRLCREVIETDDRDPRPKPPPQPRAEIPEGWRACAFCGRDRSEVRKLVAGPAILICDGCVDQAAAAA
jgi:hypothetical protein